MQAFNSFHHFRHVETSSVATESTPTSELGRKISSRVKVKSEVES
jgi:hypothetical protein